MLSDRRIRTSLIAIGADLLLTGAKVGLALLTGSAALLADAYHSGTDLVVSLVLLVSLIIRFRQERKGAQAGQKARMLESLLAIAVALLILYIPVEILLELNARSAEDVRFLWAGILGVLVILALVHFMARLKTYVGQETDSPALEADGYHSKIDLFTTLAVLASLVGLLVGINIDEPVALIIALLIAVAGIELLVSGIQGLRYRQELDPISLLEPALEWLARRSFSQPLAKLGRRLARALYRFRWLPLAGLSVAWLTTGVHTIPAGYTGIHSRFGAPVNIGLEAGLHLSLPWPVDSVQPLAHGTVQTAQVGSRHTLPASERRGSLWREVKTPQAHEDITDYLVTQDENLIDLQFALHYRIKNPAQMALRTHDLPALITRTTEAALWEETAGHLFFELLSHGQHDFAERVALQTQTQLQALGVGIQVVDAQVLVAQPPAVAVRAYRDLLNAEQEKRQYQTRAEAQQIHDRLMAQAERTQQQARVSADAKERILQAEGAVERFLSLAEVYRERSNAVGFEQQLQHTTDTLRGRRLWLTDPALDTDDIRLWGPQSLLGTDDRK